MWTNLIAERYRSDTEAEPTLAHFTVMTLMFAALLSLIVAVFIVMRTEM
jgi:hypothetical protein